MHIESVLFGVAAILLIGLGVWLKPQPKRTELDRARLATILLAEIELTHKTLVQHARSTGSVPQPLKDEMSRARRAYIDHFGDVDPSAQAFEQAIGKWLHARSNGIRSS